MGRTLTLTGSRNVYEALSYPLEPYAVWSYALPLVLGLDLWLCPLAWQLALVPGS